MIKKNLVLLLLLMVMLPAFAQENLPLNHDIVFTIDKYLNKTSVRLITALKPYNKSLADVYVNIDSALTPGCKKPFKKESWTKRKIFREDLFVVNFNDFHLYIDPLFNFGYGRSFSDNKDLYTNTRGLQLKGSFGNKLYFVTSYYETQARFPDYVSRYINKYRIAPGQGSVKDFKAGGYDFGTPYGLISYSPDKHFNLQFGYDKNFIGDGYRSLLLSDNAYQYPFFKFYMNYGWFYYQTIYTSFQNLNTDSVLNAPYVWYHGYQTKPGTFNYAGFKIRNFLEIGLFEGIVWESSGESKKLNWNMFNPLIFVNSMQYSLFSKNNVVLGITLKASPAKTVQLYGQLVLDDFYFSKLKIKGYQKNTWGFQFGGKWWDMFGLDNLNIQLEYNQVRPYTYAHGQAVQSYTHFNQPLSHPLGANFKELMGKINYRYKRIFAEVQLNYALTGLDTSNSDWGQDVFRSLNDAELGVNSGGNSILQGVKTGILDVGIRSYFLFNPKTNLLFEAGWFYRSMTGGPFNYKTSYFYFGLKTSLTNIYYDF